MSREFLGLEIAALEVGKIVVTETSNKMQGDQGHSIALLHPSESSKNFLVKLHQHSEAFSRINKYFFLFSTPPYNKSLLEYLHLLKGK